MKQTIILLVVLFCCITSDAQITLAHSYTTPTYAESAIVNLSMSGKKIMTLTDRETVGLADTIYFYNLDYSLWKTIPCPAIPGYSGFFQLSQGFQTQGVFYPSETLFNTDPLLEIAVFYHDITGSGTTGKFLIINETGAIVDSILNVSAYQFQAFSVHKIDTLGIGFQAFVKTASGISIYDLPGTLPCHACSDNTLGVAKVEKSKDGIETQPLPNPSSNQVKITFTLPQGTNEGN